MFTNSVKKILAGTAGVAILAICCVVKLTSTTRDSTWVHQQVQEWAIKPQETLFEGIGWAPTIDEGLRLARLHHRLLFVFVTSGAVSSGRL